MRQWTIRLRVTAGNAEGWAHQDFEFQLKHEAEAFFRAALLADNVILAGRDYVPLSNLFAHDDGFQKDKG